MKEVAIAIIYEAYDMASTPPKLLMQLRDPIPHIAYPGHWGLFGGHLDPGETPEAALKRELLEEIQYDLPQHQYLGDYGDHSVRRHIFSVPLHVPMAKLSLQEGWDLALFPWSELKTGFCYLPKSKTGAPRWRAAPESYYRFF